VALADGRSLKVNRQFIQSRRIDSDGDGIANGLDATPYGGVKITSSAVTSNQGTKVVLSWEAAAGTSYVVEYAVALGKPVWTKVTDYKNSGQSNVPAVVEDLLPGGSTERYYRIRYNP